MKKFGLICLCILLFVPSLVFAQDVTGSLIQPGIYRGKKGQVLTYTFELNLKDGYEKRLKSFNLSLMMDENLKVKTTRARDLKESNQWRLNKSTLSGKDVVNFSVDDVRVLNKAKKVFVDIDVTLQKDLKDSSSLKNTYVLYYADKVGNESSDQKELITTPTKEKASLTVEALGSGENVLRGKGPKNTKITLYRGDKIIGETYSSKTGNFEIVINPQVKGTSLRVEALDENKKLLKVDFVVDGGKMSPPTDRVEQGESKLLSPEKSQELRDFLDYGKQFSLEGLPIEGVNRFKAYLAMGDYILVKTGAQDQEADELLNKLKGDMQKLQPAFMKGKTDKKFAPNDSMTRAEAASVLFQLKGNSMGPYYSNFKDVKQEAWYAEAVGFVESANLMTGTGNDRFQPNKKITKAEFAAIMSKLLDKKEEGPSSWVRIPQDIERKESFRDVKENHWAYGAIQEVKDRGIVRGDERGLFHPEKTMSRAECCSMLIGGLYTKSPLAEKYGFNPYKDVKKNHWAYGLILQATGNDLGKVENKR